MLYKYKNRGFTLTEMIITLAIITIITSILLANQNKYNRNYELLNEVDKIASALYEVQAYSIGVRELQNTSNFNISYGVGFTRIGDGERDKYIRWVDLDGDNVNDSRSGGGWLCPHQECIGKYNLPSGIYIQNICSIRPGLGDVCNGAFVDISYTRPSSNAIIKLYNVGGQEVILPGTIGVRVELINTTGFVRSIEVYSDLGRVTIL